MTAEEKKRVQLDTVWKLIELFQETRLNDDDCIDTDTWSDRVLSYNDVECMLYQELEEIDPSVQHSQSKK